ncbi:MAG: chromosomal replication initiator protein DnaA [Candidatus Gastranaerophilales bacterium]|nr:chromosomal replication initiator protein DnaA [Candidatus Gastranaerophilales bacterium]
MSNVNEQWAQILEKLKREIPSESYNTWVHTLVPSSLENSKLTLLSPFNFTQLMLQKYNDVIAKTISETVGEIVNFEILYDKDIEEQYKKEQRKKEKQADITNKYDGLKQMQSDCNLNTKYQFDNFIVGEYNKLAYGAAYNVAQGNTKFNPLYIYGGSGLGKTHLMQAIGNYVMLKSKKKVKYITLNDFVNDLIENLFKEEKDSFKKNSNKKDSYKDGVDTNKRMTKFRQKYQNVDVLLIDDIQFIEGKDRTKKEFFNVFEALYQAGKQIVITSDRLPEEIEGIEDRLKTRFEWGLMADIGIPDIETRMKILQQLSEKDNIKLKLDVIELLATVYKNNIRELEGAFNKVCAYCACYGEKPTMEIVKRAIGYNEKSKAINGKIILEETAKFFGLKREDICGKSRSAPIAYARKAAIYVIKELTGESLQSIGNLLGGRKHSTISILYDDIKEDIQYDKKLSDEINTIFNIINQI